EFLHTTLRHNVLNGLNIILGNAALLEAEADEDHHPQLATIHDRGEELARFTKATTALIENFDDTTDIDLSATHLRTVLSREVDRFRHQHPRAELDVEVPTDLYVVADDFAPDLFGNLLSNALEHNDADPPRVTVTADATQDVVDVQIADNGPGIPDADKQRMQQWNTKRPDSAGTGLGLAIANTIATRYDGTLSLEDNHPTGTIAVVELPRASPLDA
ncbi:MAG: sensor histidine kinase, partial [Halobacteriaceae archaeon]